MIKTLANQFRSFCGSVQSVKTQKSIDETKQQLRPSQLERAPDCGYVTHAGIMGARRHNDETKSA